MTHHPQIYEGKAKKLFTVKDHPNLILQDFKDDATAFNALKKGTILLDCWIAGHHFMILFTITNIVTIMIIKNQYY